MSSRLSPTHVHRLAAQFGGARDVAARHAPLFVGFRASRAGSEFALGTVVVREQRSADMHALAAFQVVETKRTAFKDDASDESACASFDDAADDAADSDFTPSADFSRITHNTARARLVGKQVFAGTRVAWRAQGGDEHVTFVKRAGVWQSDSRVQPGVRWRAVDASRVYFGHRCFVDEMAANDDKVLSVPATSDLTAAGARLLFCVRLDPTMRRDPPRVFADHLVGRSIHL